MTAFTTLQIRQGTGPKPVIAHLRAIPEVLEAPTITGDGDGDLMVRLVAVDNDDLQRIIDVVVKRELVERSSTVIVLSTKIYTRMQPLVGATLSEGPHSGPRHRPRA